MNDGFFRGMNVTSRPAFAALALCGLGAAACAGAGPGPISPASAVTRPAEPVTVQAPSTRGSAGIKLPHCPEASATDTSGLDPRKNVIVLDPGHGAKGDPCQDRQTGIVDRETPNEPETRDVFEVAKEVKVRLEKAGYAVVLTKNRADEKVYKRQRSNTVNHSNAALAISIHHDTARPWDSWGEIYTQKVGLYRERPDGKKVTFGDSAVAAKSREYALNFARAREAVEGHKVAIKDNSFDNRSGVAPGNIPLVSLLSQRPFVYLEAGAKGGWTQKHKDAYAQGIVNGVKASVPPVRARPRGQAGSFQRHRSGQSQPVPYDKENLARSLREALDRYPQNDSTVTDLKSGDVIYSQGADKSVYPASTAKAIIAYTALQLGHQGKLGDNGAGGKFQLDDPIKIGETVLGSATPEGKLGGPPRPGQSVPARTLIKQMLIYSDNTASNHILDKITVGKLREVITNDLKLSSTKIERKYLTGDESKPLTTTPADMTKFLQHVHHKAAAGDGASRELLEYMKEATRVRFGERIHDDLSVAGKFGAKAEFKGEVKNWQHQIGIVEDSRGNAFTVAFFSSHVPEETAQEHYARVLNVFSSTK
ncbi:serine hydrolase [Nonomuraea basaltis]|uniref:serine hydrolase n=1 Tax=Nonomuraea basaltis TaxID=2495887 RepID=UPI001486CA30|nr:serine hydrolase [Nonomuraea basaltis]